MVDKFINVPADIHQPDILKRFLTELVDKLNNNALVSGPILYPADYVGPANLGVLGSIGEYTNSILEAAARLDSLSGDSKNYITGDLETIVLSNSEDVAVIAEQFGTFYDTSTAAAWYGLTVKTGELISGFTVGGVDSDTTTPGTAGSFFAISADMFSVGKAISDITNPSELAYVQANNLPYGTMYNASTGEIIPAFLIEWNGASYDIFFNGKVQFTNLADVPTIPTNTSQLINDSSFTTLTAALLGVDAVGYTLPAEVASAVNNNTTTINGSKITTGTITANQIAANTITANQIAANAITTSEISAGTITANKISAGNLGNSLSVSGGSPITAQLALGSSLTYANTNEILSCIYSNPLPVAVKLLIIVAGRSGWVSTSGSQAWGIFVDSIKYYDNTWTPMLEDAKAMTTTYTIPANSAVTISARAARSDSGGTASTQISISVLGILS